MYKRFKIWDVFVIISTLVLSLIFFAFSFSSMGDVVEITVDGKIYGTYSLFENKNLDINTDNGKLTIEINENKVCITDSDCTDKICVKERCISKKGQAIVCLPLRVIVKVGGSKYEYAY